MNEKQTNSPESENQTSDKKTEKPKRGFVKNMVIILLALGLLVFILQACYACAQDYQEELEASISAFKNEELSLEFSVIERNTETVVSEVTLFDLDGNEIKTVSIEQPGSELFVEFVHFTRGSGEEVESFVFPYCVYSDIVAVNDGFLLFPHYSQNKGLLLGADADEAAVKRIHEIAGPVQNNNFEGLREYTHYALHDVSDILRYQVGRRYRIVYRMNGGMEVLEL